VVSASGSRDLDRTAPSLRELCTRAIACAAGVATAGVLPPLLTGAMAVQMRTDLDFDTGALGLTGLAFFGAGALLSAAGGRLAERLGAVAAMRLAALASAASMVAIAAAPTFAAVLALLAVAGAANALAQPATNLLIARRVPADHLGAAFGVKQSAIPLAALLGGLSVPAVALTVGWRWGFAGAAAAATVVAFVSPGVTPDAPAARPTGRPPGDAGVRPLLLLALAVGLGAAAAGTIGTFLVSAAVDAGIGERLAGLLAFGCAGAGIVTRLAVGMRADRRGGRHLVTVAFMLGGGAVTYLLLATETPALFVPGAVLAYCVAWGWPGLFNLAVARSSPGAPGAASGLTQTGTYLGAVTGPLVFGLVAESSSYRWAWTVSAVLSALAMVTVVAARRSLLAERAQRAPA